MPTSSSSPSGNTGRNRPPGETSEARIAKALAHPLRARILQRLGERVASPGDLAVELDAPLGVVSYHVRMLRDYDCVELVGTEPRRGALAASFPTSDLNLKSRCQLPEDNLVSSVTPELWTCIERQLSSGDGNELKFDPRGARRSFALRGRLQPWP